MVNKMLHTKAEVVKKNIQAEEGVLDAVVGSTNVLDRMGDVISQEGWDIKAYKKNPVILWGHNVSEERPPIGKALKVWIEGKQERSRKLMFKVKFDLEDTFAAEVFRKIKDGFINTVSVGFLPVEWEDLDRKEIMGGRKYTKQELLELSFVPVPANPEAVIALRSMKDKRFEPEALKDIYPIQKLKDEKVEEEVTPKNEEPKVEKPKEPKEEKIEEQEKEVVNEKPGGKVTVDDKKEDKIEDNNKELKDEEKITQDVKDVEKEEEEKIDEVEKPKDEKPKKEVEEEKSKEEVVEQTKRVIAYKDLGVLPESEPWDGPGEEAKAEAADLKLMCAWFDDDKADVKGSYKLPHHKAEGHKAVWRGVASAMAVLLGARGGVKVPDDDKKGIYNHLKKHYIQFNKEVPDFKMVEDQVLAGLVEEVQALVLNREDKHVVRLVKKVIKEQREVKYTSKRIKNALEVINLALSLYKKDSKREVN